MDGRERRNPLQNSQCFCKLIRESAKRGGRRAGEQGKRLRREQEVGDREWGGRGKREEGRGKWAMVDEERCDRGGRDEGVVSREGGEMSAEAWLCGHWCACNQPYRVLTGIYHVFCDAGGEKEAQSRGMTMEKEAMCCSEGGNGAGASSAKTRTHCRRRTCQ
eukprot:1969338-Rhodomonas_salina.2